MKWKILVEDVGGMNMQFTEVYVHIAKMMTKVIIGDQYFHFFFFNLPILRAVFMKTGLKADRTKQLLSRYCAWLGFSSL